jgi:hypothetical protein
MDLHCRDERINAFQSSNCLLVLRVMQSKVPQCGCSVLLHKRLASVLSHGRDQNLDETPSTEHGTTWGGNRDRGSMFQSHARARAGPNAGKAPHLYATSLSNLGLVFGMRRRQVRQRGDSTLLHRLHLNN